MEYLEHITQEGERWDTLAWQYYWEPSLILPLLQSNPTLALCQTLPPGLTIRVPVLELATPEPVAGLPPWRA